MIEANRSRNKFAATEYRSERGSAIVTSLLILALMSLLVVYALSRTSMEAAAVGSETSEARTLYAAQGGLEKLTRDFNKVFERKLNPNDVDLDNIKAGERSVPGLSQEAGGNYNIVFDRPLNTSDTPTNVVLGGGPYAGLTAIRDTWRLRATATETSGTQIQLVRNILNNRIPIFQFGIFYDDDLELFNGPNFRFGGRVHSNRHFFLHPSANGAFFDSRVTAHGFIVTQSKKNSDQPNLLTANIQIRDADNNFQALAPNEGSVLDGAPNVFALPPFIDASLPTSARNANWNTIKDRFDGNIVSEAPELKLPMKVNSNTDLIELIHRGKSVGDLYLNDAGVVVPVTAGAGGGADDSITTSERFANKTGIRISLSNTKASLPGCVGVAGACGVRLDGDSAGNGADANRANATLAERSKGYRPQAMADGYQATRVNGERLFTGGIIPGTADERQVWIKVETVRTDAATGAIVTTDITRDILSLGVTEQAPNAGDTFRISPTMYNDTAPNNVPGGGIQNTGAQVATVGTDSRSIIKLQRFVIPGAQIPTSVTPYLTFNGNLNSVVRYSGVPDDTAAVDGCTVVACVDANTFPNAGNWERYGHLKRAKVGSAVFDKAVVPFPIEMFDEREGYHFDQRNDVTYYADSTQVTRNGVMSMIDIDIANLRRFLRGDFDNLFPNNGALRGTVSEDNGWVVYVSDRRGDNNFDGELDMEDVYGAGLGNDGVLQPGEDLDGIGRFGNGILDGGAFPTETDRYRDNTLLPDLAAVNEHRHFRRGVRLINGSVLPGIYDSVNSQNSLGFTLASENGVYVFGNYNATGAAAPAGQLNTPPSSYFPQNSATHIAASIVGDAVTILSNNWNDGASFRTATTAVNGWNTTNGRIATETTIRFAMIAGDTITSRRNTPHQGGSQAAGVYTDARGNGGVHNFKRFLENWSGVRLNYSGSLINLFNSRNNNGSYKCCVNVYGAPNRNWVFDSSFLNPSRIPPGTPFFQYVQTTGFQRIND